MREDPKQPLSAGSEFTPALDETGRRQVASDQQDSKSVTRKRASVAAQGEQSPARRIFRVVELPPLQRPTAAPLPQGEAQEAIASPAALPVEHADINVAFVIAGIALLVLLGGVIWVVTHQPAATASTHTTPLVAKNATVTFSAAPVNVPLPAATIAVSTAASSPIKVNVMSLNGYTVTTGAINATHNSDGSYSVPAKCGDPGFASDIAIAYLEQQLTDQLPTGAIVVTTPTASADTNSLSCSPAAGTKRNAAFTYTDSIQATASLGVVAVADVLAYQSAQLQQALSKLSGTYTNLTPHLCTTPTTGTLAADGTTLTCAATANAVRVWDATALHALAARIAGLSVSAATSTLASTPGIAPGSVQISLGGGGSDLPQDASKITITAP